MAKGLVVRWNGEESAFGLSRVDRERIYGKKERIVVDEQDRPCSSATMTSNGSAIVPAGGVALLYVDEAMDTVERSELVHVTLDGQPAVLVPSTLGVAQDLRLVPPARVLECVTTHVYALTKESVGDALASELAKGAVFETRFNYKDDYDDAPAFLLENEQGLFALVGSETGFAFIARETQVVPETGEADDDEELDFGMM